VRLPGRQGKSAPDAPKGVKRRVSESENAEGQKSSSEELTNLALGSTEDRES
jgi:hypothetical protein